MYLGIDIGSTTSKAVILDKEGSVRARSVVNTGTGSRGPSEAVEHALAEAGISRDDISYTVATGYGRMLFEGADKQITEITCHARGAYHTDGDIRTVIDVGGQDLKIIRLEDDGRIANFVMNDKCAAGTGRFLEVMARVFGCGIEELSELAEDGDDAAEISSVCTVFAESEVISQLSEGRKQSDVALGAIGSAGKRIAGLAGRLDVEDVVGMTGGGANTRALIDAVSAELGHRIIKVEHAQTVGALGAALFARDAMEG